MATVNSRRGEANLICRGMIVEQALGHMKDLGRMHTMIRPQVSNQILEVPDVGFVAPDILSRVDPVEFDAEPHIATLK